VRSTSPPPRRGLPDVETKNAHQDSRLTAPEARPTAPVESNDGGRVRGGVTPSRYDEGIAAERRSYQAQAQR
jgi:hypothetical protein